MNERAYIEGFIEALEKHAKKLYRGGMGQIYAGRKHQGLGKRVEGIRRMKEQQEREAMKGARY